MKKKAINIKGVVYPFRLTIGAMMAYRRDTGEDFTRFDGSDITKLGGSDITKLGCILYHGARSATLAEGREFPFKTPEEFLSHLDMDDAAQLLGQGDKPSDTEGGTPGEG